MLRGVLEGVFGFGKRRGRERIGFTLYAQAVAAARDPVFYEEFAVADTLDGRFDMICLHVSLLTRRLSGCHPALAQAVFDAMFTDMDGCLREGGVGDLGVPRRVKAMWEAFNGRARAYRQALDREDVDALSDGLLRNIWRGRADARPRADVLARWTVQQGASLSAQPDPDLAAGTVRFLAAPRIVPGGAPHWQQQAGEPR